MQENVSRAIAEALKVSLTPVEQRSVSKRPIDNAAAYECYLRAKAGSFEFSEAEIRRSIKHLEDGLQLIGDNALLYAGMGFAHAQLANVGAGHEESLARAHEYVEKALVLDQECAQAYTALAWTVMLEADIQGTVQYSKQALAIDPNDTLALATLGSVYFYAGKISTAAPVCDRLKRIDPIAFQTHWTQGGLAFYDGRFGDAVELWRALYERYQTAAYAPFSYAVALLYNGDSEAAIKVVDENAAAHPSNAIVKVGLVLKHAAQRDTTGAYALLSSDFVRTVERDYSFAHHVASAFAMLGETTQALEWLETAINVGFINYPMLAEHDPFLTRFRGQPEYETLLERVQREWEEFEI
jgi:non-specific serine/threonine protein kinase